MFGLMHFDSWVQLCNQHPNKIQNIRSFFISGKLFKIMILSICSIPFYWFNSLRIVVICMLDLLSISLSCKSFSALFISFWFKKMFFSFCLLLLLIHVSVIIWSCVPYNLFISGIFFYCQLFYSVLLTTSYLRFSNSDLQVLSCHIILFMSCSSF